MLLIFKDRRKVNGCLQVTLRDGKRRLRKTLVKQVGTARSAGNTGVAEQLGQGPSRLHLHPGAGLSHSPLCHGELVSQGC